MQGGGGVSLSVTSSLGLMSKLRSQHYVVESALVGQENLGQALALFFYLFILK